MSENRDGSEFTPAADNRARRKSLPSLFVSPLIADSQFVWNPGLGQIFGNVTGIVNPLGTRVSNGDADDSQLNWRRGSTPNVPIRSAHAGRGAYLLFADGRVQFLAEGIDTNLFKDLAVRDQGLVKQLP